MKVDRLISIIMILLEKERIGAQELADLFEVSPRTIYRDIDTINMAGIPVRSTSGVGGGFEIMQKYKIDRKAFSTADLSAIVMGLSSLDLPPEIVPNPMLGIPIWGGVSLAPLDRIVPLGGVAVKGGVAVPFTLDGQAAKRYPPSKRRKG